MVKIPTRWLSKPPLFFHTFVCPYRPIPSYPYRPIPSYPYRSIPSCLYCPIPSYPYRPIPLFIPKYLR